MKRALLAQNTSNASQAPIVMAAWQPEEAMMTNLFDTL